MRRSILLFLLSLPFYANAQTADSLAGKQVDSLIKVSRAFIGKGDFEKAFAINDMAEKLALEKFGAESAAYASACFNHGRVFHNKKVYPEAEKWYLQAKIIREKVLGKDHPDYTASLNNLGLLYQNMGSYERSEPLYLECKAIREKTIGKDHPDYASILNNLGVLYQLMGIYDKAEIFHLESKAIREKVLGKENPDYARSLNNLAIVYQTIGQYEKVEPLYLESKIIWENRTGKENATYTTLLNNLAVLYNDMGQFEKVEPLYLEALAINEKILGKEDPDYALTLNNLAIQYKKMGQIEKAKTFFLESKAIREKGLGKDHPDYATSLNNLAVLYKDMGQNERSEEYYLEAIAVNAKALGKDNSDYAMNLNNLAGLYKDMGQYEKAERLSIEAKNIREKVFGKMHPDYARSLNNLADLYWKQEQYTKAEPLYLEAKNIREKALGKQHPDYAESLISLATLYENTGQYKNAETLFADYTLLSNTYIMSALRHLSEQEMNEYISGFTETGARIFSFNQNTVDKTNIAKTSYTNTIFLKGFLLNAYQHSKQLAISDSTSAEKYTLLKSYSRRLAAEYAKPVTERKNVNELEERSNTLEKEIARTVAGYGEAMKQVNWEDIQKKLKTGEAAIEFINYRYFNKNSTDNIIYAALLIKPGDSQPQFITLFEERSLDSLLQSNAGTKAGYTYGLYTLAVNRKNSTGFSRTPLYDKLWKPLEKELAGIRMIYFSPSGLLHRINLGAIPVSETQTLADKYQLIELNSTRQLVISNEIKNVNNNALLYGGINFDSSGDLTIRGGSWSYLPGTEQEVSSLGKILQTSGMKTEIKKGEAATEESFKKIGANNKPSPKILHIATHGYFFPDPKENEGTGELVFKMSRHPMLRSGLILSGGNKSWKGERTLEGKEDGILTAYEISQMNLSNTELVVLSACETGLGSINGNEGVYGLQRAFKIAGAKYLIMSLWKVPDKETASLMISFYRKWLKEKMSIPRAFQLAQKELRDSGLDPEYWAGFVLVE